MNHADAERVQAVMAKLGYAVTEKEEDADVIGIVACSVRQKAIDKALYPWTGSEQTLSRHTGRGAQIN
jgi:tRNA A37 methylthiotransferase MiaB